jgi:hypothetical protein
VVRVGVVGAEEQGNSENRGHVRPKATEKWLIVMPEFSHNAVHAAAGPLAVNKTNLYHCR